MPLRRHPALALLATTGLIVLLCPTLRLMLVLQVHSTGILQADPPPWWYARPRFLVRYLVARHPNDIRVLAKAAEEARYDTRLSSERAFRQVARNYDALIEWFPQHAWLAANRLNYTCQWFSDDRVAGPLENDSDGNPPKVQRTFTPGELEQALSHARKGQALEPDNSFFDWMLAYFLFADHRDREALAVLRQAAFKSAYDSHVRDDLKAELAVRELVRPLLTEEKLVLKESFTDWRWSKMRHVARLAAWEAARLGKRGDHALALGIYEDLGRLGAQVRNCAYLPLEGLVGSALAGIAWNDTGTDRQLSRAKALVEQKESSKERYRPLCLRTKRFSDYALAHDRKDLAVFANHETEASIAFRSQVIAYTDSSDALGITLPMTMTIHRLWWLSSTFLLQVLVTAVVWLTLSLSLSRKRIGFHPISRRHVANVVIMGLGLILPLATLAVRHGAGWWEDFLYESDNYPEGISHAIGILIALLPAMLGAFLCTLTAMRHCAGAVWPLLRPTRFLLQSLLARQQHVVIPLVLVVTNAVLVTCALGSWSFVFMPWFNESLPIAVAFSFLCLARWIVAWVWFAPHVGSTVVIEEMHGDDLRRSDRKELRFAAGYRLRWYQQTLATWLVAGSLVYLILLLVSLPPRRVAERHMDAVIARGEVAMMKEVLAVGVPRR